MKLLLRISYDGSAYHGFQYQPNALSVQEVLTESVSRVMGFPCTVTGCSRTDAGVHAVGFCAVVEPAEAVDSVKSAGRGGDSWCPVPTDRVPAALNAVLPHDIAVTGAVECDDSFHPRYSVISKEYMYLLHDGEHPDPFRRSYAYHLRRRLSDGDIERMNAAAAPLLGKHDFSAFMAAGSSVKDTVRNLMRLEAVRLDGNTVAVYARADGFLYNMVRILTGTLLDAAAGKISPSDTAEILRLGDRSRAGVTAPAHGLYLMDVDYGNEVVFDGRR